MDDRARADAERSSEARSGAAMGGLRQHEGHVGAGRQVKRQRAQHEQRKKMKIEHAGF